MTETDDISTLLVEFGRIIEKIDHITTDADDRALMKAHRFIAQAATALTEQSAQIERLTRERDEAIREMSGWATKAGEAEGRLKASEWHGAIEGWKDRATTAERELAVVWDEVRRLSRDLETDERKYAVAQHVEDLKRERDEARAEVERKDAALRSICIAPDGKCGPDLAGCISIARAALTKGGENGEG